jgi:hypothetical protein
MALQISMKYCLMTTGDCIMPKEGIFAKVEQEGEAKADDFLYFCKIDETMAIH